MTLKVTVERDPFRHPHVEGEPGAWRAILHQENSLRHTMQIGEGRTEQEARLDAAYLLMQLAHRLGLRGMS